MTNQLRQAEFGKVYSVKDSIINRQEKSISKLIDLLKDTSFVKLINTADLIYPGAEKFYGHGWIVRYDIDWISVRSAWLLEELTFQNFGYQDTKITEDKLMALHKQNYQSEYLKKGFHEVDYKDKAPREQVKAYRIMLADSVSNWWDKHKSTWTRFNALKDALSSRDEQRQGMALHYLRFEKTLCDGLTKEKYETELKPLVKNIKNQKGEQTDQAKLLLDDKEYYWLNSKWKKSGN
jgi:hypothetical protein